MPPLNSVIHQTMTKSHRLKGGGGRHGDQTETRSKHCTFLESFGPVAEHFYASMTSHSHRQRC